jgi:NAD(P)-dependent dehydrogenase (short-subunit alcohol dehydrogenase family)
VSGAHAEGQGGDGLYADRVALITGSSRGIGATLALNLASQGAKVVINYRKNADLAEEVVAEAKRRGGDAIAVGADVEKPDDIVRLFDAVAEKYGRLDFFVSNAAAAAFKRVLDRKVHHLDRSYALNLRPCVLGALEAVKLMDKGGRIVAVSSYGSMRAFPTYAALGSYKAAIESFVRYMAVEFAPYGINVNGVNGGLIQSDSLDFFYSVPGMSPMQKVLDTVPLGRPGTVQDMADGIEFLLSPRSAYITGQTIVIDGGLTVAAAPFWPDTTEPLGIPERPTRS